jgi:hypothetical protein
MGSYIAWDPASNGVVLDAYGGQNFSEHNTAAPKPIRGGVVQGGANAAATHWFGADEEPGGGIVAWRYPGATTNGFTGSAGVLTTTGWYSFGIGPYYMVDFLGVSGFAATEGKGHWRDYRGHFAGMSTPYYKGVDAFSQNSNLVRGGHQILGDRFEIQGTGTVGSWNEYVVTTAGFRGITWAPGQGYWPLNAGPGTYGNPASTVEPSGGADQVWQYQSGIGSTATEPAWPGSGPFTDSFGNTWSLLSTKAKYGVSKGVKDGRNTALLLVETAPTSRVDTGAAADATTLGARETARDAKTTTDATTNVVIHSYTVPAGGISSLTWTVTCIQTAGTGNPTYGKWKVTASYFNNGGTVTVLDAAVVTAASANTVTGVSAPSTNISGTAVQIRVTGVAVKTYKWRVTRDADEAV